MEFARPVDGELALFGVQPAQRGSSSAYSGRTQLHDRQRTETTGQTSGGYGQTRETGPRISKEQTAVAQDTDVSLHVSDTPGRNDCRMLLDVFSKPNSPIGLRNKAENNVLTGNAA